MIRGLTGKGPQEGSLKITSDSKNNGIMRFLGSNSSVSEPTTIVGHDLKVKFEVK